MANELLSQESPITMLVILAHPDDESFAVGGTLAKFAKQGVRVILICATRGEAGISGMKPEEVGKIREGELREAAKHLGIEVYFLGYRDGEPFGNGSIHSAGTCQLMDVSDAAQGDHHFWSGWGFRTR